MTDTIADWAQGIHQGDAAETLAAMPESSVHMCMTSPPYFGLRDYGAEGQIGLEDSLDEYIQELVEVGQELRRVLRPDGNWWLNLGDSYASKPGWGDQSDAVGGHDAGVQQRDCSFSRKDKMLVPHRVAIALQRDGWVVRNDVTWVKPNPMPQSVKDRLNTTTEQIFHLTPEPDYWYDLDAIREPYAESYEQRAEQGYQHKHGDAADGWADGDHNHAANHNVGGVLAEQGEYGDHMHPAGKNPGDVFEVTTKPFPDAHFAVYPPELCEKPIKATAPPKVCAECGAPYEREVERDTVQTEPPKDTQRSPDRDQHDRMDSSPVKNGHEYARKLRERSAETLGWQQSCGCDTDATESGIVLDPFAGAGTTCLVAKDLGRRFIGVDLNPEYVALAQRRVGVTVDEPERLLDEGETSLVAFADGGADD